MKRHTLAILTVICIFALASCFSPFDGGNEGEGTIVINIGAGDAARIPVSTPSDMTHIITLTGPGGTISHTLQGPTGTIAVAPGTWTVNVRAEGPNEYWPGSLAFGSPTDIILRAVGNTSVTVTAGASASAAISMISAAEVHNEAQLSDAIMLARTDGQEKRIFLMAATPTTLTGPILVTLNRNITLVANSGTRVINRSGFSGSPMFMVNSPGTLRLGMPDGMVGNIEIHGNAGANAAIIQVNGTPSNLIMNANVRLTGNSNTATSGGAVALNGTFTMNGGLIDDNNTNDNGGGVAVFGGAVFNMTDGTIFDNTAANYGGGVGVMSGITTVFNMSGGTIASNSSLGGVLGGGGVMNFADSTFTMSGGAAITGNTANNAGGGVFSHGPFNMNGGTISGNTANLTFGGGVAIASNTFTMTTGTISGNQAPGGGGVYITGPSFFNMSGGAISGGNVASASNGGGLFVNWGAFNMTGGSISGNTAAGNGGGVHLDPLGSFNITNATIHGSNASAALANNATGSGDALFVMGVGATYGTGSPFPSGTLFFEVPNSRNASFSVTAGGALQP